MIEVAALCSSFSRHALDLLYPHKCPLCGLLAPDAPCFSCVGEMVPIAHPLIQERQGPLSYRAALYDYNGRAGQAVRRLKYARSTALSGFLASQIARAIDELALSFDVAVPVPIHWTRWCERGFNQSDILAGELLPDRHLLKRIRATRPQVGLNREQRTRNLDGAFRAGEDAGGKAILLIDDVVTSGQTAKECAKSLLAAGANEVGLLAFCGDASTE